jgi:hypothetical protein
MRERHKKHNQQRQQHRRRDRREADGRAESKALDVIQTAMQHDSAPELEGLIDNVDRAMDYEMHLLGYHCISICYF